MIWKAQLKHELHWIFCASNHCPFIFVMDKWIEKFDESCLKSFRLFLQGHFDIFYWADSMICMLIFQKGDSTNYQTCPNLSRSPETHWVVVFVAYIWPSSQYRKKDTKKVQTLLPWLLKIFGISFLTIDMT